MKKMLIAIDPGKTGAIASVSNPYSDPIFDIIKMPGTLHDLNKELTDLLTVWSDMSHSVVWIEKAQGGIFGKGRFDPFNEYHTWMGHWNRNPDNVRTCPAYDETFAAGANLALRDRPSASRTFNYGQGYGEILGILVAKGVELHEHRPQDWMKRVGAWPKDKPERKTAIHDMMQKIYAPQGVRVHKYAADAMALLHLMIGEHKPYEGGF